ncbi:MAG: phage portal protein [Lachnospiraceae bacterium]|nr:phage portal protein [Lachnospiraceae bacterium]
MGSFTKWLSDLFGSAEKAKQVENGEYEPYDTAVLELERVAIQTGVGYLAAAVSQSDFRTFLNGQEVKKKEHYLWNIAPNDNQNSTQFLQDLVGTLVYNNEVLVVEGKGGQLYVADSFIREEEGTRRDWFSGITIRGEPFPDRPASAVMYLELHNEDVRPMLSNLCHQYETIIKEAMNGYQKTNADKGILVIDTPKGGKISEEYEKIRKDLLGNRFKDFFSAKSAVLPLHAGYSYTPHTRSVRNTSEVTDIKNMSDEVYNRVGQALRIPPTILRGEVANNESAFERFMQMGVRPICNMLTEEITRKRYGMKGYIEGSYVMVDPSNVELGGVFNAAAKIDKLISCGLYSIDEVRGKVGEPLLGTPEAQRHYITRNYQELGNVDDQVADGQSGKEEKSE